MLLVDNLIMDFKLLVLVFLIEIVKARISIDVKVDQDKNISISYAGIEANLITEDDIKTFGIEEEILQNALGHHLGKTPRDVYLKSPTPWGDLYKTYKWEQVKRVLSIKSVRIKNLTKKPTVVLAQDFENASNHPIKVNTGISHTIENTLTTSWTKEKEFTVSQEIEYDFNVAFAKVSGTTSFSYTTTWGVAEDRSETETIGATSGVETELQPGQAVTAILSASAGYLDIEVLYKAALRGNVAVNFRKAYSGHHFWGPLIQDVMESGGIHNQIITTEIIRFGFHVDASLKVYDKATGEPI